MKTDYIKLNRADGAAASSEGGYEFGTLWQEITNGIGHMTTAIVNGLQVTERTKQLEAYLGLQKQSEKHQYHKDIINSQNDSNTGFYIIGALFFAAVITGLVFAVKYKKK